ncbi:hypothetical protein [Streptomyces sp. Amel2xC10]|nr:hypothetical protein [Streptomyces sp. Amel2xC10]
MATSLRTTVYNAGIAGGSLTGGLVLERLGPAARLAGRAGDGAACLG